MKLFIPASKVTSRLKQALYSGKYYQKCDELPYYNFIKLVVSSDLSYLIISGRCSPAQLAIAWQNIQTEYSEISKDESALAHLELLKEIYELNGRLVVIESACKALSRGVGKLTPEFIKILRSQGYGFRYTDETMEQDIERTISRAKTYRIRLKELEAELPQEEAERSTEQDYYEQLSVLYPDGYDVRKLTVAQVIAQITVHKKKNTVTDGIERED